jgi:alpha-amylase
VVPQLLSIALLDAVPAPPPRRHLSGLAALFGGALLLVLAACEQPPPGDAGGRVITSNVEDWRDEVIYQVIIDRFADGDYANNRGVEVVGKHLGRYQGGDYQGVIDRLPYLKELGITTVWISPVVRNVEQDAGFSGYHGYWTQDFLHVNPHFGDLAKLQQLVDTCHAQGIKVILDIVTNHIGQLWYYDINNNGQPDDMIFGGGGASYGSKNKDVPGKLTRATEWDPDYDSRGVQSFTSLGEAGPAPLLWVYQPEINRVPIRPEVFQNPDFYHRRGRTTVWENKPTLGQPPCVTAPDNNTELCDYVRQQEIYGDFPGGLKDLATERPEVRQALIKVFQHWIEVGDFDGFRIDTLKHVEHEFWREFCPAMRQRARELGKQKFLMFGEAFSGADTLLSSYTQSNEVDSVFYFSQKYRIDGVFKGNQPTSQLQQLHDDRVKLYSATPHADGIGVGPNEALVNFMDNHDVERFLNTGTVEALHVALTYLMTTTGIPCIYYGTEQQFSGGNDPSNREVMWLGNAAAGLAPYDTTNATFQHIKTLGALRKQHAALRRGDFTIRWSTNSTGSESDAGIFAYERTTQGSTALVVLNAASCGGRTHSQTSSGGKLMSTSFPAGTTLTNVLPDADPADDFVVGAGGLDVRVPCQGAKILVRK